jgi:hypothetical protein
MKSCKWLNIQYECSDQFRIKNHERKGGALNEKKNVEERGIKDW